MSWDVVLGYATGLRVVNPAIDTPTLLRTVALLHLCDAVLCRLFAHNNGYNKNRWTAAGLIFGIWAVGLLLLLPKRTTPAAQ
ncbi:MAG: hypothetical protein U0802_11830 [Candidatus Binatia bacterium]